MKTATTICRYLEPGFKFWYEEFFQGTKRPMLTAGGFFGATWTAVFVHIAYVMVF